jgi:2-hydroxychromene-2-carboxylate isomerase
VPATIEYFFVPQSPWTYLGHERFCALLAQHDAALRIVPCDIAKVFAVSGGLPLAQRAVQRQAYRLVELKRFSEHLAIPLHLHPKFFPVASDDATRLIIAADEQHGAPAALALAGRLGRAVWADERDISDASTLAELASELALDGTALLEASRSRAVDQRYQANTREAIERGVFGAPTYFLAGEMFWGQDRLEFLARALLRHQA